MHRTYYLAQFVGQDHLDPVLLAAVTSDFDAARHAGVKLVVRFAYSARSSQDAPVQRVVGHIQQLVPILNAGADVIATLQAGFIGRWGEWYYSDNFASDGARPWLLSDRDWEARGVVLQTLLELTSESIFVQVRYPSIKQRLLGAAPGSVAARVGFHNDCFLASPDDCGTFPSSGDSVWLMEQTRTVPMSGETCAVNPPRSEWPSASAEFAAYRLFGVERG